MANILQWFISESGKSAKRMGSGSILQQELVNLFYHSDKEAVEIVQRAYDVNNRNILFTPKDETSYWHKFTLKAAQKTDSDPEAAAEHLLTKLNSAFFEDLRSKLKDAFFKSRDEEDEPSFGKSRFESLLYAFGSKVKLSERTCAVMTAMMFAELVFYLEEKRFRPDDGAMLAGLMEMGSAPTAEANTTSGKNNVYMKARRELEKEFLIGERIAGASDVWMYNMTITGLVWGREKKGVIDHKRGIFEKCLDEGTHFTVIIPEPGSIGEEDSAESKLCQTYPGNLSSLEVMKKTRDQLVTDIEERTSGGEQSPISLYFTPYAVPYSMMVVRFDDHPEKDHVKIDLHTPYLSQDLDRRSFFVSREDDPDNYKFFEDSYARIRLNSISYEKWKKKNQK